MPMEIICCKNYEKMSKKAAQIVAEQIVQKRDSVLGLATGSTPLKIYEILAEKYDGEELDFGSVTTINLDEYKGLSPENKQSYHYYMNYNFFHKVNVNPKKTFIPDGMESDAKRACEVYDQIIRDAGGIDLQLLGLGNNGHIGFNEPGDSFDATTHLVNLTASTINANKRFFEKEEDVPRQAYTVGIKTIMQAKKILLVVSGESKADILAKAFLGPVTNEIPASILKQHKDVTIVGDEAALSKLMENSK